MDYQKSKYSEDTDIDDGSSCKWDVQCFRSVFTIDRDRLRHHYLLTTESMQRMPKAFVNNRSIIIVGSCKQFMLLYFQR